LTSDDVIIYIISNNVTATERVNHCEHFKAKLARIGTGNYKVMRKSVTPIPKFFQYVECGSL